MGKWNVKISDDYEAELVKTLRTLTDEEKTVIYKWIKFVEKNGPYALSDFNAFETKEHKLTRQKKWKDCYSSSFSRSGRIIYKIKDDIVLVEIVRITPNHDYS